MKNIDMTDLPLEVLTYITQLRKEAQQMRRQRNGARDEADRLRAALVSRGECREIDSLRETVEALQAALFTLESATGRTPTFIPAWLSADIESLREDGAHAAEASIARMLADRDEAVSRINGAHV